MVEGDSEMRQHSGAKLEIVEGGPNVAGAFRAWGSIRCRGA
jgi:hypothetical protein